ncbi:MAG: hypothetical protein O3C43_18310 [Verrucomicrobia bacterium]|nr:hypothetical protein [Verrucomicrobiota bacterium]MDA1068443.1 hypothetical protein [Verrucomicrobiota bacterium]
MIHFVTTHAHTYTNESLIERHGPKLIRLWTYDQLFLTKFLTAGTWIFTDHERLSPYDISRAAHFGNLLKKNGARVLNHPAQVRSRFEILRRLKEAGINQFSAYRCESEPRPLKFPVFVRNEFDHDSEAMTLIETQVDLDAELDRLERNGIPLIGKIVIEYSGEPIFPNVWQRLSTYCVAGEIIPHHMGFHDSWVVKSGFNKSELETHTEKARLLDMERAFVKQNQHVEILRKAFSLAGIEYGRADFSIKDNRVQIFEINTNPTHASEPMLYQNIHPEREELLRHSERRLQSAIVELNQPDGEGILLYGTLWNRIVRRLAKVIKKAPRS